VAFDEIAPILCAGVTVYKGIRVTDTRPGQWISISGIGGLGHVAVQYATAMGLHVAAVDVSPEKLDLARKLGAQITIDASKCDPAAEVQKAIGGAHGVLVTAVSRSAFAQALGMVRRGGTVSRTDCLLAISRFRSSPLFLTASPFGARSSARGAICRKRSILPPRARYALISTANGSRTSTRYYRRCVRARSTAESC
jgi:D-arabinose 1-dehydrogenase-like Zn-dependent alcohol dehydrogenase